MVRVTGQVGLLDRQVDVPEQQPRRRQVGHRLDGLRQVFLGRPQREVSEGLFPEKQVRLCEPGVVFHQRFEGRVVEGARADRGAEAQQRRGVGGRLPRRHVAIALVRRAGAVEREQEVRPQQVLLRTG